MKTKKKNKWSFLRTISMGQRLRLRDDVAKQIHAREWLFKRVEKDGTILLVHEKDGFGWNVNVDDIDWKAYRKEKDKGQS
jgi:hypothetical protein